MKAINPDDPSRYIGKTGAIDRHFTYSRGEGFSYAPKGYVSLAM